MQTTVDLQFLKRYFSEIQPGRRALVVRRGVGSVGDCTACAMNLSCATVVTGVVR